LLVIVPLQYRAPWILDVLVSVLSPTVTSIPWKSAVPFMFHVLVLPSGVSMTMATGEGTVPIWELPLTVTAVLDFRWTSFPLACPLAKKVLQALASVKYAFWAWAFPAPRLKWTLQHRA
jgi:hypothetical protein